MSSKRSYFRERNEIFTCERGGEGKGRVQFGWSVTVLWEETGFRLDLEGCGWVRSRDKHLVGIGHGMNKHRGRKE